MMVFHGSAEIVRNPDVGHSYRMLDFGAGFYVTTVREQAERWARRKAAVFGKDKAVINIYQMDDYTQGLRIKEFDEDLMEWLDFVCDCRDGKKDYLKYDLISGKVADDKVFRVVDMYHAGIWDKQRALREMKVYASYHQAAFITQRAIDRLLVFESFDEV